MATKFKKSKKIQKRRREIYTRLGNSTALKSFVQSKRRNEEVTGVEPNANEIEPQIFFNIKLGSFRERKEEKYGNFIYK